MKKVFKRSEDSKVILSQLMLPSYSNFSGKIHGGHILNLMDQIAFACGSKHSGAYCVTASVNSVNFLVPIEVGELVTLKAAVNYTGNTSMVIGLRVESQNIQTGEIKHSNSSYFTMIAKDSNGKSISVPGLILETEESVRRFVRSIKRQEEGKSRINNFKENTFELDKYLHLLEGRNALVKLGSDLGRNKNLAPSL